MPALPTPLTLEQYRQHGAIFPLPALSEAQARQAYQHYLQLCAPGQSVPATEERLLGHLHSPWIAELVSHPAILRAVRALIGPNVLVWVSEFNSKAAGSPHFFSWHQDLYYWRHQYPDLADIPMLTVWLALSEANADNGAMRIVPGTHHQLVPHESRPCAANLLTRAQHVTCAVDESQALTMALAPGEFSIHHPLLLHASGANHSQQTRVGLVTRYMAPEVKPSLRPAYAWLVSGEDRQGHWDHVAPGEGAAGLAVRRQCMQAIEQLTGAQFR